MSVSSWRNIYLYLCPSLIGLFAFQLLHFKSPCVLKLSSGGYIDNTWMGRRKLG